MKRGDVFRVWANGKELAVRQHPQQALNVAQIRACNYYSSPVTLIVERESVIGPRAKLYRVDRDADGCVYTTTLALED